MTEDKWIAAGREIYGKLRGSEEAAKISAAAERGAFTGSMSELALAFAFGGVWSREGLSLRERSLVTIGALVALRQPDELRKHVQISVRNGLTTGEIREVLIQTIPYAGFPAAASALTVATAALGEIGIDPDEQP